MKFNEVCEERFTGKYEFIAANSVPVHNHRFMRLSNNKLIVPPVHNLMIISQYSLIQNKSTLGIYLPNYLLNSVTWLVAVNFGSFW